MAVLVLVGAGARAPAALAHDPGQGDDAGTLSMTARARGLSLALTADTGRRCDIRAARLVARRAGKELTAPMRVNRCSVEGALSVSKPGRWFLYTELDTPAGARESWLPVRAGGADRVVRAARFVYVPRRRASTALKNAVGAIVYALMGGSCSSRCGWPQRPLRRSTHTIEEFANGLLYRSAGRKSPMPNG